MSELQKLLDRRGITLYALSQKSGVSLHTVQKYVATEGPYYAKGILKVYWKFAESLGVDIEYLLLGDLWHPDDSIIRYPICMSDAVRLKASSLGVCPCAITGSLRGILSVSYQTFSSYNNYHGLPAINRALQISTYLGCTLESLWGTYLRRNQ